MITRSETEQRVPMAWEEYLQLDEPSPSEYLGGQLVVSPFPNAQHARIIKRLQRVLDDHLPPGAETFTNWGWSPEGVREEVGPDVMVVPATDDAIRFTGVPLLVVEVLSGNRTTDLVEKSQRYFAWGCAHYWVVDPRDEVVLAYAMVEGQVELVGRFKSGEATLSYGEVEVPVDIDELLA